MHTVLLSSKLDITASIANQLLATSTVVGEVFRARRRRNSFSGCGRILVSAHWSAGHRATVQGIKKGIHLLNFALLDLADPLCSSGVVIRLPPSSSARVLRLLLLRHLLDLVITKLHGSLLSSGTGSLTLGLPRCAESGMSVRTLP